jgi:hypothetical protein
MDSDEKELNVDKIGYQYKAEDNDKKFRIKGILINYTIQTCALFILASGNEIQLNRNRRVFIMP